MAPREQTVALQAQARRIALGFPPDTESGTAGAEAQWVCAQRLSFCLLVHALASACSTGECGGPGGVCIELPENGGGDAASSGGDGGGGGRCRAVRANKRLPVRPRAVFLRSGATRSAPRRRSTVGSRTVASRRPVASHRRRVRHQLAVRRRLGPGAAATVETRSVPRRNSWRRYPFVIDGNFVPSGWFAGPMFPGAPIENPNVDNIASAACAVRPDNPAGHVGFCTTYSFQAEVLSSDPIPVAFAGVVYQHPANNWGITGGLNVAAGANALSFRAWGELGEVASALPPAAWAAPVPRICSGPAWTSG